MANVRYAIVFGTRDTADRFIPQGEFYLRGATLEKSKLIFEALPDIPEEGDRVLRLYERYYDKHLEPDINYEKSEYTIETNLSGLQNILTHLIQLE